ncbi:hypothetical protein BPSY_2200 [Bifidobacterium psychraerophilum]|uniref:Uncharacterized protein n=1 Tax=Bifidobacterium psychraerophilum TaxID=218140 RepID=A0A087CNK8_9BIFI|nr:hypothetical protein BPSY_2200 [Bifidobacterium psychraerophilum]
MRYIPRRKRGPHLRCRGIVIGGGGGGLMRRERCDDEDHAHFPISPFMG